MTDNSLRFEPGIHAKFIPQPDITTYELAQLLPFFLCGNLTEDVWEKLGPATRHLERMPDTPPVRLNWGSQGETPSKPQGVVE